MKRNPRSPRLSPLSSAIALATGATLLLQGSYVRAQDPPADELEEITVTGTRIQRTSGFATPVPVTAVTIEEIQSFKPGTTMADQLDQLPQFYQTQSAQRGGGALFGSAGGSYLDLRAMGPARTLILLDGARVTPADRTGVVNVDNFPTALLRSVEVVTGGASAAYGADALAGVTNFILNRDFRGMNLSFDAGTTDAGDGDNVAMSVAGGLDIGERWSFIGSFESQTIDQIQRNPDEAGDWYRRWGWVQNPAWNSASPADVPRNLKMPDVHSTVHTPTGKIDKALNGAAVVPLTLGGQSVIGQQFTMDGRGIVPFVPGTVVGCGATPACLTSGGAAGATTGTGSGGTGTQSGGAEAAIANDAFNGGPYGAEVRRDNIFAGFTFDPTDNMRLFSNLILGKTESNNLNDRGILRPECARYADRSRDLAVLHTHMPIHRAATVPECVTTTAMRRSARPHMSSIPAAARTGAACGRHCRAPPRS